MKILYHHRTQGRGGEGVHERGVINALRALGNTVIIVSPPGADPFLHENQEACKRSKPGKLFSFISRYSPQIIFELLEIFYNFYISGKIKNILKEQKIDFIYERYAFFCWIGVNLAKRFNIPIMLEVNEVSGIKRTRKQTLVGLANRIEKKIFKDADIIVTVSSFLKEYIENLGTESQKVYLIPNAVNIEEFKLDTDVSWVRDKFGLNGQVIIGFVGMFCEWDNLGFLIETFAEVAKAKRNVKLVLIGDGKCRKELEQKACRCGVENHVIFTGLVHRKQMPDFIKAIDICVIPNSNPFGSPIILFEYMAMAKPVVAPKLKPMQDVIEDNSDGILFETGSKRSFKKALDVLIDDPKKRRAMSQRAREKVIKNHTWLGNAKRVIEIASALRASQ